jgi:hypothetical protein
MIHIPLCIINQVNTIPQFGLKLLHLSNIARNDYHDSIQAYQIFREILLTGLIGRFLKVWFRITEYPVLNTRHRGINRRKTGLCLFPIGRRGSFLRWPGAGSSCPGTMPRADKAYTFGAPGWVPVLGDWNSDGRTKIGVTNSQPWYLDTNGNGVWDIMGIDSAYSFGAPGWSPIVGKWD